MRNKELFVSIEKYSLNSYADNLNYVRIYFLFSL